MITVSELIDILTQEVSKDTNILNCGVRIDDRNLKVLFVHPKQNTQQEPYEHWKEVKMD